MPNLNIRHLQLFFKQITKEAETPTKTGGAIGRCWVISMPFWNTSTTSTIFRCSNWNSRSSSNITSIWKLSAVRRREAYVATWIVGITWWKFRSKTVLCRGIRSHFTAIPLRGNRELFSARRCCGFFRRRDWRVPNTNTTATCFSFPVLRKSATKTCTIWPVNKSYRIPRGTCGCTVTAAKRVESIRSIFYPQICVFWKNIAEQLLVACIRYAGT